MPDDFFVQEQKMAIDAMKNCCRDAWKVVQQDTNLKPLIRKRPLASLAAAAVGGLVAGYLLTPPHNGRRRRKEDEAPGSSNGEGRRHGSFLVTLEHELAGAVSPALRAMAASTAGALISGIQQGYAHGESPQEHEDKDLPHHRIQF